MTILSISGAKTKMNKIRRKNLVNQLNLQEKRKVTIYLGSKCNLSCAYCHREPSGDESSISPEFLKELQENPPMEVKFMGGEPLLYVNEIKKVVEALPNARFSISTNGMGIEKHLDYFRKHDFLICISYDGAEKDLRGFDPFTALFDYPNLAVSTTLYHGNTDLDSILKKFREKEKIIGRSLSLFPHLIHVTNEENRKFALTEEDYDSIFSQYKTCVRRYLSSYLRFGIEDLRYQGIFMMLVRRLDAHYSYGETYCSNALLEKRDWKGRRYPCLYIRQDELGEDWLQKQQALIDDICPGCRNCPVYDMCGSACIVSKKHSLECAFYKKLYAWFKQEHKNFLEEVKNSYEFHLHLYERNPSSGLDPI